MREKSLTFVKKADYLDFKIDGGHMRVNSAFYFERGIRSSFPRQFFGGSPYRES